MHKKDPVLNFSDTKNNIKLELSIVDYQFPNNKTDNWCLLKLNLSQENNIFITTDPAIEAMDLIDIINWFKCLSNYKLPKYGNLIFIEPCIEFKFIACHKDCVRISISLNNEMQPNFKLKQFGMTLPDHSLCFDLHSSDFYSIISNLESLLDIYPVRSKR